MEKTTQGSLGAASAFQLTENMNVLDKQSKKMLQLKEVLVVILRETVEEYQGYSETEIMEFIEADSITEEKEFTGFFDNHISAASKGIQREVFQIHKL